MTTEQSVLLKLIRQSQFDTIEDIAWDDIDLDELYEEANQQAVLGLIAPLIPEAYSNDTWRKAQFQQEASYIRYCYAQDELKKVLDDANIPFVILKGNASAIYYKEPMRRAMGDIDFLVHKEQFNNAKAVLLASGYNEGKDGHRHLSLTKNGTHFELHHRFSHEIDIEEYITNGLVCFELNNIDCHYFPMLPKLANGLVLLDHMRNHLMRSMGLRQLIDWMMYAYNNLDDSFWTSEFKEASSEKNLDSLAIAATRACQLYLGLPDTITWCNTADEKTCCEFIDVLLSSGNFGCKNGTGSSVETVITNIKCMGVFRWLQYAGEENWETYHNHRWLKPLCWLHQIYRYANKGFRSKRTPKQLKKDLDRNKNRYDLLKKLKIDQSTNE